MISEVYNMDCMELLRQSKDKEYDLAICDPPYGIGFDHKIREKSEKKWDSCIPKDDYFIELQRVSKNQIIWGANYFSLLWKNGCRGFIFWNSGGDTPITIFNQLAQVFPIFYFASKNIRDTISRTFFVFL